MTSEAKLDLVREHKSEFAATREPALVDVPAVQYLAIEGSGAPGSPEFQSRLQALFTMAYTIKFIEKREGRDFRVPMLEGLYRDRGGDFEFPLDPARLEWTLQIRVPDAVTRSEARRAAREAVEKGKTPLVSEVRLSRVREGRCAQVLHVGPYDAEAATVARLEGFARDRRYRIVGPHHEIYLSDPRRVDPSRLRTLLRYPVRRATPKTSTVGRRLLAAPEGRVTTG